MRSGGITATSLNYTGQRRDDTGLLYYNARYYDSSMGRFISADTVVPGAGALTVAASDVTERGAWAKPGSGPGDPQALNRYGYGLNNPLKHTDPTGHCFEDLCIVEFGIAVTIYVAGMITANQAAEYARTHPTFHPSSTSDSGQEASPKADPTSGDYPFKPGKAPKASEVKKWAEAQGWKEATNPGGPPTYVDENGTVRVKLKSGSNRPGLQDESSDPHVEMRNASGERVDPYNPNGPTVKQRSDENHRPIKWDLD